MEKQVKEFSNIQHHVSVISGKEDGYQRRLFEHEQEIKDLRKELVETRGHLEDQASIAQLKSQEVLELLEDI